MCSFGILVFLQELDKGRKGRIYSLLIMYNGCYILDGDLLNSALLV